MASVRLYSKNHIWAENNNGIIRIGLSEYAQGKLGNIIFVNLPDIGDSLVVGEAFGDVESVKTVTDLISPVTGRVTAVNDAVVDEPNAINQSPYDSWLIETELGLLSEDLFNEEQYNRYLETL